MAHVGTHTPDQESLFGQLRQSANDIDWEKVRAIVQKHGSHAAQWKDTQNDGQYPLHYACWHNGPLNVIQTILTLWPDAVKERDKYGNLPLHYACENNQSFEVIQLLIAKWSDAVEEKDDIGYLPLHYACRSNQSLRVIKLLVNKYPAAVKEKDNNGYLPLHYACRHNQTLEVIQWLVKQWPDTVREKDKVLQLPLHLACGNNQSLEVIEWLVKQWPQSIQERNRYEKTPLDFAQHPWFGKQADQATVSWLEKALKVDTTFPAASSSLPTVITSKTSPVPPSPVATPNRTPAVAPAMAPCGLASSDSTLPFAVATLVEESPNHAQVPKPSAPPEESLNHAQVPQPDRSSDSRVDEKIAVDRHNILRVIDKRDPPTPVSPEYVEFVKTKEVLGVGLFGIVYRGVDSFCKGVDRTRVNVTYAVKQIRSEIMMEGDGSSIRKAKETFATEQKVLSNYRHPNIAALFGYSFAPSTTGSYYLVYELGENGDLYNFLSTDLGRSRLSFLRRVQIALDVAVALCFLHSGNKGLGIDSCCHRDIKSANIVLTGAFGAKLIDVGLATFVKEDASKQAKTTGSKGTPGYIDPQYANGAIHPFKPACDIFSLGIVMVELWTGRHQNYLQEDGSKLNFENAYTRKKDLGKLTNDVDQFMGFDGSELPKHAKDFVKLAIKCMTPRYPDELKKRPTAEKVLDRLQKICDDCETQPFMAGRVYEKEQAPSSSSSVGDEICTRCSKDPVAKGGDICIRCRDFEALRQELTKVYDMVARFQSEANAKLDSSLHGHAVLNARLINPVPRCFVLVPREQKVFAESRSSWFKGLMHNKYWLYFLCEDTFTPVQAPIKLDIPKSGIHRIAPVLAISLHLLQAGIRAGTFIDFDLTSMGQGIVNVSAGNIGEMLHGAIAALKESNHSKKLVELIESGATFDEHEVGRLYGQSYQLITEKAYEQSQWRLQMVQVQMSDSYMVKWVKQDVAEEKCYTIVKH